MLKARTARTWTWHQSAMVVLLMGAALLAFRNLKQGFPYLVHADEWQLYVMSQEIVKYGHRLFRPDYSPGFVYVLVGEDRLLDLVTPDAVSPYIKFLFGRLTSAAMGMLTLATLFAIGKRFKSPLGGLLVAGYIAFLPEFVDRIHTLMPDAGATLWGVLALWTALLAVDGSDGWLAASVVAGLLAFVTKFNALPAIGLAPLAAAVKYWNRPRKLLAVGGLVLLGTLAGVALLHWRIDLLHSFRAHDRTRDFVEKESLLQLVGVAGNWESIREAIGVHTLVIALGLLPAGLTLHRRWTAGTVEKLVVVAGFGVAFFFVISLFEATYLRDMLLVIVSVATLWGLALAWLLPERYAPLAILAAAILVLPHARTAAQSVRQLGLPHTGVLATEWFLENVPQGTRLATEEMLYLRKETGYTGPAIYDAGDVYSLLDHSVADYQGWGVEYLVAAHKNSQKKLPASEGLEVAARIANEGRRGPGIVIFAVPPLQQHVRYLWLGDAISFRGYDLPRAELQPGHVLEFSLYWMSVRPTDADYVADARLVDPESGQPVAQHESQPDAGNKPTSTWEGRMQFVPDQQLFVLPPDLQPGVYDLQIALYDAASGKRLPITDVGGQALGDSFSLGEVTITR